MNDFNTLLRLANDARTRIREIPPAEADDLVASGAVLLDVREESEYRAGHISGSVHLSRQALQSRIGGVVPDLDAPIVVYCTVGHRSALAADTLQKLGYRAVASIAGGLNAYLASSAPRKSA
jgi:rhodanese-related sulfurtransferase